MGTNQSKDTIHLTGTFKKHTNNSDNKPHLLCLHGWRTSGEILSMQTAALRYNAIIDCTFVNAPFLSIGKPDDGISFFYKDYTYYEWYLKDIEINDINNKKVLSDNDLDNYKKSKTFMKKLKKTLNERECIDASLNLIMEYIDECAINNIIFDGVLGFSQGAQMVTRLVNRYQSQDKPIPFKYTVLISGVPPTEINSNSIDIDSLHIYGKADPLYEKSKTLKDLYNHEKVFVLEHDEGHNIPSINTNIYSNINQWLYSKSSK